MRRGRLSSPRETHVTVTIKRRTVRVAAVAFVLVGLSGFALGWISRGAPPPPEAPAFEPEARKGNKLEEVDALSFHERLVAQHGKRIDEKVEPSAAPPPEEAPEPAKEVAKEAAKEDEPPPPKKRKEPPASAHWGVQIGAFQTEAEADAFIATNRAALKGKPVYVLPTEIPEKGTWYRVRVGAHAARKDADAARGKLPPELGKNAMVVGYR